MIPGDRFNEGLFDFVLIGRDDNRYDVRYRDQGFTTLCLSKIGTVMKHEYSAVLSQFKTKMLEEHKPTRVELVNKAGGVISQFSTYTDNVDFQRLPTGSVLGGSQLIVNGKACGGITIDEFIKLAISYKSRTNSYITRLLPEDVMTQDHSKWRSPNRFEIIHLSGLHSLTGITHEQAAHLIGVTASNFRKYLAKDSASARASISFSAWHVLMMRLKLTGLML